MSYGLKWGDFEGVSSVSYTGNETILSETRAEPPENDSSKLSNELLRLFGFNVALDAYYTFLEYNLFSEECDGVEGSIEQLARLDA